MSTTKENEKELGEHPSVTRFREYLRIETVQPKPDYATCTQFLTKLAKELGLEVEVLELVKGKPVVLMTWKGSDSSLSSILLNSHTDVVPVFPEKWTHPPFSAYKSPEGNIYARGAQDMKCVGISYLEAIRYLKLDQNFQPLRTVHVLFVPDEEIGGLDGMVPFLKSQRWKDLNVSFVLDEGMAYEGDGYKVYYGERAAWWIKISAIGNTGHGSQFIQGTAIEKLNSVMNKLLKFREAEMNRLNTNRKQDGTALTLGDVTTLNLTLLNGGVQYNVVPSTFSVGCDIRISPLVDLKAFRSQLEKWCQESNCSLEFIQGGQVTKNPVTQLTSQNPFWKVIQESSQQFNIKLLPEIFPAATDSRFIRESGVAALGISPMRHTKVLLHDHDEFLNEKVYLEGIDWYVEVIRGLSSVSKEKEEATGALLL